MIGDGRISISALEARLSNVGQRHRSVAPFRVHLEIAAVLPERRTGHGRVHQNPPDLRAAQKVPPELASPLDVGAPPALVNGALDGCGAPGLENLPDDPR